MVDLDADKSASAVRSESACTQCIKTARKKCSGMVRKNNPAGFPCGKLYQNGTPSVSLTAVLPVLLALFPRASWAGPVSRLTLSRHSWQTTQELETAISKYIDFYNTSRIKVSLGGVSIEDAPHALTSMKLKLSNKVSASLSDPLPINSGKPVGSIFSCYFQAMNRTNTESFKPSSKDPTPSVADVQRVRRQRRLAQTEEEYSEVRSHMRDLAGELKSRPTTNSRLSKISGIAIIVLGLIIGSVLFYAASFI